MDFIPRASIPASLAIVLFLAALTFYQTPMDGGFSMVAVLVRVRKESLKLLAGPSLSGRLSRPVRMKIAVRELVSTVGNLNILKLNTYLMVLEATRLCRTV